MKLVLIVSLWNNISAGVTDKEAQFCCFPFMFQNLRQQTNIMTILQHGVHEDLHCGSTLITIDAGNNNP